jgi:hypothetical protein
MVGSAGRVVVASWPVHHNLKCPDSTPVLVVEPEVICNSTPIIQTQAIACITCHYEGSGGKCQCPDPRFTYPRREQANAERRHGCQQQLKRGTRVWSATRHTLGRHHDVPTQKQGKVHCEGARTCNMMQHAMQAAHTTNVKSCWPLVSGSSP